MQADPQRQWFIYFKEKEIGPLTEADVSGRFEVGEIDGTAYVYSEGMPDWALLSETPVFVKAPEAAAPTQSVKSGSKSQPQASATPPIEAESFDPDEGLSFEEAQPQNSAEISPRGFENARESIGQALNPRKSTEPTLQTASPAAAASAQSPAPAAKKRSKTLSYVLAALALALGGLLLWTQKGPSSPKVVARPPVATAVDNPDTIAAKNATPTSAIDWEPLLQLRNSTDRNAPGYRLAKETLGNMRPILVGALSSLLKSDMLTIAVFPDTAQSLMVLPRVWFLKVPVVDGFFSAGPLNLDGAELPPGKYRVMVRVNTTPAVDNPLLGEVAFEIGQWPANAALAKTMEQIQSQRLAYAQKEKASLDAKLTEVNAAVTELKTLGKMVPGPKALKEFNAAGSEWVEKFTAALNQQYEILKAPAFYTPSQLKLYDFMHQTMRMYEALELNIKGGPRLVAQKQNGKGLGQLWAELSSKQQELVGEVQSASEAPSTELNIDPEVVKRQLLEMK